MRGLNLGSGRDSRSGYVNLDLVALAGVDVVADLEARLPFADSSFEEILCVHVLEHVDRLIDLLAELHRISRPQATIKITSPHLSFFGAYTDPTHRRFFGYFSFDYFTDENPYNFYSALRFRIKRRELRFFWIKNERTEIKGRLITALVNLWPRLYERFFCWMLPVNEVYFELEPVKSDSATSSRNRNR